MPAFVLILLKLVHVAMCIILILIVLLQTGKGAEMASAFGGAGSQTVFGRGGGMSFMHRLTTVAAILFMVTSLALGLMSGTTRTGSVVDSAPAPPAAVQPATSGGSRMIMDRVKRTSHFMATSSWTGIE